ncbi:DUF2939 domain-containing protein [Aurantiacibacter aquimixticola]|uniref:DUF2939 domain-containing protein n=1 Tax=Aurantiacibacter aquimixticola TaxID=1958945 RepID=A0A419RR62_9SPHN|nr:DUF2939 domain-containing protein [Aurantiacibacter aquimixticola]RJY08259.1 DUF2939 domain-containing protein [Aurantiacibacter aquimixticola]
MKKLLALILLAAALAGGWYFASPWWAMKSLADAAQAGDTAALEEKVDFPALRASASDQISEATRRRAGQGGLLDGIGGVVAERVGREVANRAITPENVGAMVAGGAFASGLLPERLRGQDIGWNIERESFDYFRAIGTFEDGTAGPTLIFRRDGLGWLLTGVELT